MKHDRGVPAPPGFPIPHGVIPILCFVTRHWLTLFTLLAGAYVLLALAAPVCMAMGWTQVAEWIYALYAYTCHQLPAASYFVLGQEAIGQVVSEPVGFQAVRSFSGDSRLGYKTALCQRNLATYSSFALMGLVYTAARLRLQPLPFWVGILCSVPMAVDGLSQMLGLRESHWVLRSFTGSLFSAGVAGTLWPRIQFAMEDVNQLLRRTDRDGSV